MASLLVGTSVKMNIFTPAMAAMGQGMGQYDNHKNKNYQTGFESTYGNDPYANSYDKSYNYDKRSSYDIGYDKSYDNKYGYDKSYDKSYDNKYGYDKSYDNSYDNKYGYDKKSYFMDSYGDRYNDHKDKKNSYFMDSYGDRYNDHKDKIKKYECRTGQFEGFLVSSVEFCDAKHKKFHR
jgi:hypothetical protein